MVDRSSSSYNAKSLYEKDLLDADRSWAISPMGTPFAPSSRPAATSRKSKKTKASSEKPRPSGQVPKQILEALEDRSWAISPSGAPFAVTSRPVLTSSRKSKNTSSEQPRTRDQLPETWFLTPTGAPFATSARPSTCSRSPSSKPDTDAASTYSTSTTMTEKPLLTSSSEKPSRWSKTKQFISSIGEPPTAEQAAKRNTPAGMPVLAFGPFNDRKPFGGRL